MPNVGKGKKGSTSKPKKNTRAKMHDDDMPLDASVAPEEEYEEESSNAVIAEMATPFEDGLVHKALSSIPHIPRVGGEETAVLKGFLDLFARTETFIGAIYSKTSFMKKTGGRLL